MSADEAARAAAQDQANAAFRDFLAALPSAQGGASDGAPLMAFDDIALLGMITVKGEAFVVSPFNRVPYENAPGLLRRMAAGMAGGSDVDVDLLLQVYLDGFGGGAATALSTAFPGSPEEVVNHNVDTLAAVLQSSPEAMARTRESVLARARNEEPVNSTIHTDSGGDSDDPQPTEPCS